jgi:DNA-binding XRE family transcriptional regulator
LGSYSLSVPLLRDKIRHLREELGLTRQEAADRAKISVHMWRAIEQGWRDCSLETARRIALVLGIAIDELIG